MHHIFPDRTVLFADAFGLTRISAVLKVKTDAGVVASPLSPLCVSETARQVWIPGPYSYQSRVLSVDTLATHSRCLSLSGMLPDGCTLLDHSRLRALDGAEVGLLPHDQPEARAHAPVGAVLGTGAHAGRALLPRVGLDGRILLSVWEREQHTLVLGTRTQVLWSMPLVTAPGAVLWADFAPDGVVLVRWSPLTTSATVWLLSAAGATVVSRTLVMQALPALDGTRLVYQPDAETVVSLDLPSGAAHTWHIAAVTAAARRTGKAPLELDNIGVGQVIAGQGRALLVPWHGEAILDLDAPTEVPRKLAAASATLRAALTTQVRSHRAALVAGGSLLPVQLKVDKIGFFVSFWGITVPATAQETLSIDALTRHMETRSGMSRRGYGSMG